MGNEQEKDKRAGFCPVYDIKCPDGSDAVAACEARFRADYNPLTSFRDADIEHCAIYRQEQREGQGEASQSESRTTGDVKE